MGKPEAEDPVSIRMRQFLEYIEENYVMEARLSKAADLLTETGLSVGEIASGTGFSQQSYFGKRFKEKTGMTPLEYRKKMRT